MSLVEAQNITIFYPNNEKPVVKNISFSIDGGECLLLMGPTGSGKSTLLLTIAGAIPHHIPGRVEGSVTVAGKNALEVGMVGLVGDIGLLFQDPEIQIVMPIVFDEVAFPLENLKIPREKIIKRAQEALDKTSLGSFKDYPTDILSTGQKQKLALASIMAMDPKIYLLDEPTAHIDPKTAREIYSELSQLKRNGAAIILVEHRIEYVLDLVDKILYIDNGQGIMAQNMEELIEKVGLEKLLDSGVWIPASYLPSLNTEPQSINPTVEDADPTVQAKSLQVQLDGKIILHDIDFTAKKGETTVIIGPNGSGKTTLLKTIAGLIKPKNGQITVQGKKPSPTSVAYVTQIPDHQFTERTVEEEIRSVVSNGSRRTSLDPEQALKRFGLEKLRDKVVYELSQGEKRLVSLLEMILLDRPVYLLDEPTFGLDLKYSLLVLKNIEYLANSGKTVILVTHDSWLVTLLQSKIYGLSQGRIVFAGSLEDLLLNRDIWQRINFDPPSFLKEAEDPAQLKETLQDYRETLKQLARSDRQK